MKESLENIKMVCKNCRQEMYPDAGTFTIKQIKEAKFVKKCFDDKEHMWVRVERIDNNIIFGTLANKPVLIENLKLGDPVKVVLSEVEAITKD